MPAVVIMELNCNYWNNTGLDCKFEFEFNWVESVNFKVNSDRRYPTNLIKTTKERMIKRLTKQQITEIER